MTMTTTELKKMNHPLDVVLEMSGAAVAEGVTKSQFEQLLVLFPEYRMEWSADKKISIMAPVKGYGGYRENDLAFYLTMWCRKHRYGRVGSSSGGFELPDGSVKSPDVSWTSDQRLASVPLEAKEKRFLPIAPDFVAEIRSSSDRLRVLKKKMADTWMANGIRLAWLIDPYEEMAYVYRADGSIEIIKGFDKTLSGENILPGLEIKLDEFRLEDKK